MTREMKDSGIEWIPVIPVDWEIKRNKGLFYEVNDRCDDGSIYTLLSVSEYTGVSPRSSIIKDGEYETHAESLDGYKLCKSGDIVMNIMLAWKRATAVSNYNGIVSPAYSVYRGLNLVDTRYYHYLFRTDICADMFKRFSTGIIDSRLRLYPDVFLSLKSPAPSFEEQSRIASFLDTECARIDTVIEKTRASIEEYKKLKQAIITQAVTKGIRPNRQMKDSGIKWIGEIPEDWSVTKIKYVSSGVGDGLHAAPEFEDDGKYYFINGNNLGDKQIRIKDNTNSVSEEEYAKYNQPALCSNAILIALNGTYGLVSFYNGERIMLGKSAGYVNLIPTIKRNYVRYALLSDYSKRQMDDSLAGTTIANISLRTIKNLSIAWPTEIEQEEISMYLDTKCAEIDKLLAGKAQLLSELESYKKSLIFEYVTGKKEVPA